MAELDAFFEELAEAIEATVQSPRRLVAFVREVRQLRAAGQEPNKSRPGRCGHEQFFDCVRDYDQLVNSGARGRAFAGQIESRVRAESKRAPTAADAAIDLAGASTAGDDRRTLPEFLKTR